MNGACHHPIRIDYVSSYGALQHEVTHEQRIGYIESSVQLNWKHVFSYVLSARPSRTSRYLPRHLVGGRSKPPDTKRIKCGSWGIKHGQFGNGADPRA